MKIKRELIREKIKKDHGCKDLCFECNKKFVLIDKMYDANIPVAYWLLTMKDFSGSPKLKEIAEDYILNIKEKYNSGKSICFSGNQGTGKTMVSVCILRTAIKNGFKVYYITASDLLTISMDRKNNIDVLEKIRNVDFLTIDELDSRFFVSDSFKELFSSIYENIFRNRAQNMLPTILCTNETDNILNVFYGQVVHSIKSLNAKHLEVYPIAGKDFRKNNNDK